MPVLGAEQRQAVSIRYQAAARRTEGEIGASRQRNAKCLPVQSPVEETEVRGVHINEDTARVEDR